MKFFQVGTEVQKSSVEGDFAKGFLTAIATGLLAFVGVASVMASKSKRPQRKHEESYAPERPRGDHARAWMN